MKKIILGIYFVLVSTSQGFSCDLSDPICVTRILVENTARFNSVGMERFYCPEERWVNNLIGAMKKELETIQENDKAKYSEVVFDFSNVTYNIQEEITDKRAVVQVSGRPTLKHEIVKFDNNKEIKGPYILHKVGGAWVLCSSMEKAIKTIK